jgi:hypothetical protein
MTEEQLERKKKNWAKYRSLYEKSWHKIEKDPENRKRRSWTEKQISRLIKDINHHSNDDYSTWDEMRRD